jgi:chromosome segregation ATPase
MQRVRTAVKELLRVELVLMEAESDRIQLETRNRDVIRLLEEKRRELAEVKVETKRLFKIYESHHRMYQNIVQELDADAQTIHAELMQRTPKIEMDELEADITSARQRIELVSPGNPRILAEYQKRARDIEQQAAELARTESEEGELGRRIADIRGRWEPRLDRLVARISDAFAFNFEQIRCAGQVSLHKDEDDFEKWAILIHVKFR